ncbi:MAG: hypothetical protein JO144_10925 [Actinobacteria bacterium]|nr:hypothetical protein [Actinomycetota bacterium]
MITTVGAAAAQRDRTDTVGVGSQPPRLPGGLALAASGTSTATSGISRATGGTGTATSSATRGTDQPGRGPSRNAGRRSANRSSQPSGGPDRGPGAAPASSPPAQLGAFVNRSMVVAPPRVSIRPADLAPAAAGPPVPTTARPSSTSPNSASQSSASRPSAAQHGVGIEADGPVIRRSLAGTAHSLFRSLLRNPGPGGPGTSSDPVPSGSTDMFESFQHAHGTDDPPTIRRLHESGGSAEFPVPGHDAADDQASPAMRARDFDELIDRIVAKLEQRITDDLERRGRRHLPEVF